MKDDYKITFIRGATTAKGNTVRDIEDAVVELIDELISRNNLIKTHLLSITFTATILLKQTCYQSLLPQPKIWMHVFQLQLQGNVMDLIQLHF